MKRMMEKVRRVVISLLCILMLTSHFKPVMSSGPMDETELFETQVQEVEEDDVQDIEHEDIDNEIVIERNNTGPVSTTGHPLQFGRQYRMFISGGVAGPVGYRAPSVSGAFARFVINPSEVGQGIRISRPGVDNPELDFGTVNFNTPLHLSQLQNVGLPSAHHLFMREWFFGAHYWIYARPYAERTLFTLQLGNTSDILGIAIIITSNGTSRVMSVSSSGSGSQVELYTDNGLNTNWEFVPVITHNLTVSSSSGGTASAERNVLEPDQVINITATPNTGYRFVRWEVTGTGSRVGNATNAQTTFTMGSQNATVEAVFELASYPLTVTHTAGGTLAGGDNQIFELAEGIVHRLPSLATIATHHRFVRWEFVGDANGSTLQNATNVAAATVTMGTGPVTVQAVFERITHSLAVSHTEGGTITGGNHQTIQVGQGVAYTLPTATPTAHHRFVRWEFVGNANGATLQNPNSPNNATLTMGTGATTVQAVFERITHSLAVSHTEGGTIAGGNHQMIQVGQGVAYTLPTATPTAHHRFVRWEFVGNANGATLQNPNSPNNATLTMGTGATTVQAVFERITHSLAVSHTEGGTIAGGNHQMIQVGQGVAYTLPTATPTAHHRFVRWEFVGNANGATLQNQTSQNNATTLTMGTGPASVQAVFERITHSLAVSHTEGGSIAGEDNQTIQVGQGVAYALPTATPTAHHRFVRWEFVGNANGATLQNLTSPNNATLTMGIGPASVQAVFEQITHSLAVSHTEGGTIAGGNHQTIIVGQGTVHDLPIATPTTHHRFVRWEFVDEANGATLQNPTSPNNAILTMGTGATTVQAVFEQITHPLIVTHTEGGTIAGEANQTIIVGQGVAYTLPTATPTAHHRFIRWEFVGNANGATLQNPTSPNNATLTMGTGPVTVQAVFERITHPLTVTHTEGGTLNGGNNQTFQVRQGVAYALPTATPTAHHRFVRWEFVGNANGATLQNQTSPNNATLTMGTGPVTVQAVFERATDSSNSSDEHQSQGRLPQSGVTSSGGVLLLGFGISLIVTGVVMSLKRHSNKRH